MYFKDTNNTLHFLDSAEFEYLLPADCVAITDEEAQAIQAENDANKPIIIPNISMRQARLALLADGLLDDIDAALSTPEYKIWWEYSTVVERNNYLVNDILKILGKSDEEIDQMFIGASQL
jgi:hypothetical protein